MSTPHISADKTAFAKTVIMPGDPLRAKYIAENYLTDAVLVNNIRGIQGYTGLYKGKKVSVMASGMGCPSMAIYSYELFNFYDVENIIRVGTAGGLNEKLKLKDIAICMSACTDSNYGRQFVPNGVVSPTASFELIEKAVEVSRKKGINPVVGTFLSSDIFYNENENALKEWAKMGVISVEMESAALYLNAMRAGKNALTICTISDLPLKGDSCTAEERQTTFTNMMEIALEVATKD